MKDNAQTILKKSIRRQQKHGNVNVQPIGMNGEIRKMIKLRKEYSKFSTYQHTVMGTERLLVSPFVRMSKVGFPGWL